MWHMAYNHPKLLFPKRGNFLRDPHYDRNRNEGACVMVAIDGQSPYYVCMHVQHVGICKSRVCVRAHVRRGSYSFACIDGLQSSMCTNHCIEARVLVKD